MADRPLVALGAGLAAAVVVAALLVPVRAWATVLGPVLVTVLLGAAAMALVARRRPPAGEEPGHDPFGLLADRLGLPGDPSDDDPGDRP